MRRDSSDYPRMCRLCGGQAWRHDLVKYGTRDYAHPTCFIERKTIKDFGALPLTERRKVEGAMWDHAMQKAEQRNADRIDGYDRDDLGESPDY